MQKEIKQVDIKRACEKGEGKRQRKIAGMEWE